MLSLLLTVSCTVSDEDNGANATVRVIKTKRAISKGTVLAAGDIDIVVVEDVGLPEGYIKSSSDAIGRKLLSAVEEGTVLTAKHLSTDVYTENGEKADLTVSEARALGYVVVTDYINDMSGRDLSTDIQKIIDQNPNSTIYFPDGVYTLAKTIKTSSDRTKSVALHLSANAVIKAADFWVGGWYLIQIGILDKDFGMDGTGTNYYMYGGIIDCNGTASGIEISAGREFSLRNVTIKNAQCGLHIAYNAEYGSNDSDTEWLNIEGNGKPGSVGVVVDGFDNTLSNVRISGFETGMSLSRPGTLMHNIHVINTLSEEIDYENTQGFSDTGGGNWYDGCRADNFRTAFYTTGSSLSVYNGCTAFWSESCGRQYAFESNGGINITVTEVRAIFVAGEDNALLVTAGNGGKGIIKNPIFNEKLTNNDTYKRYLVGNVMPIN